VKQVEYIMKISSRRDEATETQRTRSFHRTRSRAVWAQLTVAPGDRMLRPIKYALGERITKANENSSTAHLRLLGCWDCQVIACATRSTADLPRQAGEVIAVTANTFC
jgi:hypothetical protein